MHKIDNGWLCCYLRYCHIYMARPNSVVLTCNDNKVLLYSILHADRGLFLKATISIKFLSNAEALRRLASFFRAPNWVSPVELPRIIFFSSVRVWPRALACSSLSLLMPLRPIQCTLRARPPTPPAIHFFFCRDWSWGWQRSPWFKRERGKKKKNQ